MTTASLTIAGRRAAKQVKSKVLAINPSVLNWKWVLALVIIVFAAMLIVYIAMVNQLTQGAYLVKNYHKEISQLTREGKALEASFAESSFLQDVRTRARDLSFYKAANVKYIQIGQSALAKSNQ